KSLLGRLGTAVMGALGQQQRSAGLDAGGLATLLASQKDQFAAAIPSALADRLSGAGLLDTVEEGVRSSAAAAASAANRFGDASERTVARASQAASAARSNAMSQLPLWLIALAVLAGVTWYFLGSHGGGDVAEQTRPTTTQQVDQPRNVATERGELPRATTGAATQNLSVGGVDLAKQVGASVGSVKAALAGITDVNSAQAALPKIQEATAEIDKIRALAAQLPPEGRQTLAGLIAVAMPPIHQLCDKVLALPGVAGIAKPTIDQFRERADSLARA